MQQLEIVAIVLLVVAAVIFIALGGFGRRGGDDRLATRLFIGSVVGLLGGIVILIPHLDVVPDGWQTPSEPILIGGVTLLLVLGSIYRMMR